MLFRDYRVEQGIFAKWLLNEILGACLNGLDRVFDFPVTSHHYHRKVEQLPLHGSEDLMTAHLRHAQIEQDNTAWLSRQVV